MENNAQTEITVLNNLKANFIYEIDKLIEIKESKKGFESPELASDFFHFSALVNFQKLLNKEAEKLGDKIIFKSKDL